MTRFIHSREVRYFTHKRPWPYCSIPHFLWCGARYQVSLSHAERYQIPLNLPFAIDTINDPYLFTNRYPRHYDRYPAVHALQDREVAVSQPLQFLPGMQPDILSGDNMERNNTSDSLVPYRDLWLTDRKSVV